MENVPVRINEHGHKPQDGRGLNHSPKPKKRPVKAILLSVIVVVVLAGLVLGGLSIIQQIKGGAIDRSKYQAVFLTSGQVYFGKLENSNGDYLRLTDVFYLQTKTASGTDSIQNASADENNVELIKLGSEIHGPEDEMVISRDQVLFYENLKSDGRVSQSIENYRKQ